MMSKLKDRLSQMPADRRRATLATLANHLVATENNPYRKLYRLLTQFSFLDAKVKSLGPQPLIDDYDLTKNPEFSDSEKQPEILDIIQETLQLSADILAQDRNQLPENFLGRLLEVENPAIQTLLQAAKQEKQDLWLCPIHASLTQPGNPLKRTLTGHTAPVTAVGITPDSQWILSTSEDETLKVWNLSTGEVRTFEYPDLVNDVVLTNDGKLAIVAAGSFVGEDSAIAVQDLSTGSIVATFAELEGEPTAIALSPDRQLLVVAVNDLLNQVYGLNVLRFQTQELLYTLYGHDEAIMAIDITPDGSHLVSASLDKTLTVWNLPQGTERRTLHGHAEAVQDIAITPDGCKVISASTDRTLKAWDLETGQDLYTLAGHQDAVTAVAMHPSGQEIISASKDNTIRVWDLKQKQEKRRFFSHMGVRAIAIASNGQFAVSAADDRTVKVWDFHRSENRTSMMHRRRSVL